MINKNKNLVFNCDECRSVSSNMIEHISNLTNEVRELKKCITKTQTMCEDINMLKKAFDELLKNLELPKSKQAKDQQKEKNHNNNNTACNVVGAVKKK